MPMATPHHLALGHGQDQGLGQDRHQDRGQDQDQGQDHGQGRKKNNKNTNKHIEGKTKHRENKQTITEWHNGENKKQKGTTTNEKYEQK